MRDEGAPSCGICGRKAHGTALFPPPKRPVYGMGPSRPADFDQRVRKSYQEELDLYRGQLCQCSPPLQWLRGAYVGGHLHVPDVQTPGRVAGGSSSPVSLADEIRKLDVLRRNGVLTDGEFQKLKRRLIGQA